MLAKSTLVLLVIKVLSFLKLRGFPTNKAPTVIVKGYYNHRVDKAKCVCSEADSRSSQVIGIQIKRRRCTVTAPTDYEGMHFASDAPIRAPSRDAGEDASEAKPLRFQTLNKAAACQ